MLCSIGSLLHFVHDLLHFHQLDAIFLLLKESDNEKLIDIIPFVLKFVEFICTFEELRAIFVYIHKTGYRFNDELGLLEDNLSHLAGLFRKWFWVVDVDTFGYAVDSVDSVINGSCQVVYIFTVEWGDE